MDKYYTPELEEIFNSPELIYKENVHINPYVYKDETKIINLKEDFDLNITKVKYLNKEDIESLGFNITKDNEEIELSLESKRYIGGPSAGDDYKIIILYGLDNKEM